MKKSTAKKYTPVLTVVPTTQYKIDKHIALPPQIWATSMYPFDGMLVGDSFFKPGLQCAAAYYQKGGRKYTVRTVVEGGVKGVRVWRVK